MKITRLAALLALTATAAAHAQPAVPETSLAKPTAVFTGEFALIRNIRELANGAVLVADPITSLLTRVDPTLKKMDTLGRNGRGPGEYIQPDGIWPLPADSSVLVDLGNSRLTVVAPNGKLGRTQSLVATGGGDGPPQLRLVGGVDKTGSLWFGGMPQGDSLQLFRLNRTTDKTVFVANITGPPVKRVESGSTDQRSVSIRQVPLGARDGWAVASTGALFVVRAADYHVDVIAPNGTRTRGPVTPYVRVLIGSKEKEEYHEDVARNGGLNVNANDDGSGPVFTISRLRGTKNTTADLPWPTHKAPFDAGQIFVDARDRLWVRRNDVAGRAAVYDVFDINGRRIAAVRLPTNRSIVGFGAVGLYVAARDADDLQRLERYAIPLP